MTQVGNWSLESDYWGTYEPLTAATMPRPGYNVSTADGASDLAGSMAAAFAASALVFKQSDPAYSAQLQTAAVTLYTGVSDSCKSNSIASKFGLRWQLVRCRAILGLQ